MQNANTLTENKLGSFFTAVAGNKDELNALTEERTSILDQLAPYRQADKSAAQERERADAAAQAQQTRLCEEEQQEQKRLQKQENQTREQRDAQERQCARERIQSSGLRDLLTAMTALPADENGDKFNICEDNSGNLIEIYISYGKNPDHQATVIYVGKSDVTCKSPKRSPKEIEIEHLKCELALKRLEKDHVPFEQFVPFQQFVKDIDALSESLNGRDLRQEERDELMRRRTEVLTSYAASSNAVNVAQVNFLKSRPYHFRFAPMEREHFDTLQDAITGPLAKTIRFNLTAARIEELQKLAQKAQSGRERKAKIRTFVTGIFGR